MTATVAVSKSSDQSCCYSTRGSSSETRRVLRLPNPRRVIEQHDVADIASRLLSVAFAGRSENAVCEAASHALGVSENTIRAILRGHTTRIDARIVLQAAAYCMTIGIDPMRVAGLKDLYERYCGSGR